jgi:Domain of unknown function (DUF4157)
VRHDLGCQLCARSCRAEKALRPDAGLAGRYGLLAGRQLGVPVSEPGRDLLDRHGLDRHGIDRGSVDRRTAESAAADQHGTPARPGPPIAGLSTGRGLDRWPSLPDDTDPLGGSQIPGNLVDALRRRAGTGSPLAEDLQRAGGEALGRDLSGVRVHTDAEASRLADSVQASAFSYGQDIYFAAGGYRPGEDAGRQLIAHELGHVGQDAGGGGVIGRADDPAEAGADRAAVGVLSALRRQATNVAAVRRSPALAPPSPGLPPDSAIRRAKRKKPHKGGGGKRRLVAPPVPPAPPPAIGQVAAPLVAPPDRSYQSDGQRLDPGDAFWFKKGKKKDWRKRTLATVTPEVVPTPRSTGAREPNERQAGNFTVKRQWEKLSGQGFIVQQITRDFTGVEVHHGGGWQAASDAVLGAYMAPLDYAELHRALDTYWEIFEVGADGNPLHNDQFQLAPIADAGSMSTGSFADTSRGTYVQTGTAYYVPTTDSLATFAGHFGMALNAAAPANGLYSRTGGYGWLAVAETRYPVSRQSTFTVTVTWDTDSTRPRPDTYVNLRISEGY